MLISLATGQAMLLGLRAEDVNDRPAPVTNVRWQSSDPAKLVVSPYPDGMGAHIAAVLGSGGAYTITVTADGNLDPGSTRDIVTTLDVTVTWPNSAAKLLIVPGDVIGQPQ